MLSPGQRISVYSVRGAFETGSTNFSTWHALGQLADSLTQDRSAIWRGQTIDVLAELTGQSAAYVYHARKFSRLYSDSEAAGLEGKLTWLQMTRLVGVDDKKRRRRLLNQCKNWTVRELDHHIRVQVGRQRRFAHGGRPNRLPQSRSEALVQLESLLTALAHWHRGLEHATPSRAALKEATRSRMEAGLDLFPKLLRSELGETIGHVEKLREKVERAIARSADQ
jgi:hypothetical protein